MQKQAIVAIIILVVLLLAGIYLSKRAEKSSLVGTTNSEQVPDTREEALDGMIHLFDPTEDASIYTPLTIVGEARGAWFFEGSFPVRLYDAAGTLMAEGVATSSEGWMTEDFIPFEATLTFSAPTTETGTLVLVKDNPSGDPVSDMSLVVPVRFDDTQ